LERTKNARPETRLRGSASSYSSTCCANGATTTAEPSCLFLTKERDAQCMVSKAQILVTEWEDDGQFEYTTKVTVICRQGSLGLQWFTGLGNGPLKPVCTNWHPVPDPHGA